LFFFLVVSLVVFLDRNASPNIRIKNEPFGAIIRDRRIGIRIRIGIGIRVGIYIIRIGKLRFPLSNPELR
jgi:hypothetical protein